MKTIILDIDGCCRDIVTKCCQIYRRDVDSTSLVTADDVVTYDMKSAFPKVDNPSSFFFKSDYAKEIFTEGRPFETNIGDIVNSLRKNYQVHIVTLQFPGNEQYTIDWLAKYGITYDFLTFTGLKADIRGNFIVDDYPKHLDESYARNQIVPICVDQPYNQEYKGIRIKKLSDLEAKLNAIE